MVLACPAVYSANVSGSARVTTTCACLYTEPEPSVLSNVLRQRTSRCVLGGSRIIVSPARFSNGVHATYTGDYERESFGPDSPDHAAVSRCMSCVVSHVYWKCTPYESQLSPALKGQYRDQCSSKRISVRDWSAVDGYLRNCVDADSRLSTVYVYKCFVRMYICSTYIRSVLKPYSYVCYMYNASNDQTTRLKE